MKYDLTLYNHLKDKGMKPCKLTTNGNETIIRCPYCGDSQKSKWSTHFYIQNISPFKYFCQRCNANGIMDTKTLNALESNDTTISHYINTSYKTYISNMNKKYGNINNLHKKKFIYEPTQYTNKAIEKIDYFNNRLGTKMIESDLSLFKIILNLEDFYNKNNIKNDGTNINLLNNNYFSYLLNDGNTINCRNMYNDNNNKHFKNKIYKNLETESNRFFSLSNNIELNHSVYNVHIAEGFFDIVSVFINIYDRKLKSNDIFIANNGKGYKFVLNYLARMGILNMNINIYSDFDVKLDDYKKNYMLGNCIPAKLNGVKIYYNLFEGEKDFGVPKDKIKISEPILFR